jgi:methionyl-tRNA formyltransferase
VKLKPVLLLFIDDKIDTGAMILSSETPIEETEKWDNCTTDWWIWEVKLSLPPEMIEKGTVSTIIQTDTAHIKTAYKLNKENCKNDQTSCRNK